MKIKSKNFIYSILGSLILIFSVWFYAHHFNLLFDSKLYITCKAVNEETKEPINYAEIVITRIEKPWYAMWSTQEIISGNTNEIGEFTFQISESKRYYVKISKEYKKRFIGDFQTYTGGTEFEGNEVSDGEIILIPCDNRKSEL
ncbi:hypothetical protein O4H26_12230 [Aequorivita viscosa]|nr:hypothetical protein [Aequorivita viscosa]